MLSIDEPTMEIAANSSTGLEGQQFKTSEQYLGFKLNNML